MTAAGSTAFTRWGLPLGLIWAGLMLSAWVHTERLQPAPDTSTLHVAAVFLAVPGLQLVVLGILRAAMPKATSGRHTDLLVAWLMTFLFGVHAAVLAVAISMVSSMARALPLAVCLLLIGIGPVLALLEPKSPLGIRTKATLADATAWQRTHRFAAAVFVVAGLMAPLGLLFEGLEALYVSVAPAVFAVGASVLRGLTIRAAPVADASPSEEAE